MIPVVVVVVVGFPTMTRKTGMVLSRKKSPTSKVFWLSCRLTGGNWLLQWPPQSMEPTPSDVVV